MTLACQTVKRERPVLSIKISNKLIEIHRVAELVEAFGDQQGVSRQDSGQINLVLDELLTNTISYGYPDGGRHEITLVMQLRGHRLAIMLEDDAIAFNPLDQPTPDLTLDVDERPIGGFGIHFMRTFTQRQRYCRRGDSNRLVLIKELDGAAAEPAPEAGSA